MYTSVVKALLESDEWALDVLIAPFGGAGRKDTHGEWFSPRTNTRPEWYPTPPVIYYHGFSERKGVQPTPEPIGRTVGREVRADGIWFRVVLDQASAYAAKVWAAAQRGAARASPGGVGHLIRKATTGELLHWPIAELSLFDTDDGQRPASPYAVAIPALKSVYAAAGIPLLDTEKEDSMDDDQIDEQQGSVADATATPQIQAMIAQAIKAEFDARQQAEVQRQQAEAQHQAEIQTAVTAAVQAARHEWEAEAVKARRLPGGAITGAPHVRQFADVAQYDGLSVEDQVFLIGVVNSRPGMRASQSAYKAAFIKASEAAQESHSASEMTSAAKAAGLDLADAANAAKANELMHTTQTGYGDEWIGVGYSTQLWLAVRDPTRIAGMLPEIIIPQGSEGVYDPLEGTDPTFYKVPEATATNSTTGRPDATITASKAGTERKLHTATKVGGRIIYTGEMEENALIPMATQLRQQLETAAEEALEHVIIDGDTTATATTNINDIGNGSAQTSTNLWLSFDGFRKLALVTNTANSRDGGALTEDDFLETAKLMGTAGLLGADVRKALFIIDANVRWKILTVSAVKTRDVFLNATIENGDLTGVYGYRIYTSYAMHKASAKRMANTAGKIHGTDSNNTTGSIIAVRPDQWKLARKRRVTIESARWIDSDANQIVLTMSAGLQYRDTEAAAISYNLTI